jgi:TRAP-type transport system periplasmic protein
MNSGILRRFLGAGGVLVSLVFFFSAMSLAAEQKAAPKVQLRVAHQYPDSKEDYRVAMLYEYVRLVEEKSAGQIKINMYPAESLYKAKAAQEALMAGTLDMCVLPLIYASGKIPALNITLFPCVTRSRAEILNWKNEEIGRALAKELLKNNLIELASTVGGSAIGSVSKPVIVPADLKGMQARVPGKYMEVLFQKSGAGLANLSSAEIYTALQRGILDIFSGDPGSFLTFRYYELVKFYNPYPLYFNTVSILMAKSKWDKLSKEHQNILLDAIKPAEKFGAPIADKQDQRIIAVCKEKGVTVHSPREEEFKEWEKAAQFARERFIADFPDAKRLLALADEANAGYRAKPKN